MAKINALPNPSVFFWVRLLAPANSLNWVIIDKAMGSIITVVAVFEIHMERKAEAKIKPKMICLILVPVIEIILRAMRLCRFHFCIAKAKINPPTKI